jgi:hypothetical protein
VVVSQHGDLSDPIVDEMTPASETALAVLDGLLDHSSTYFWLVTATNDAGERSSEPGSFTTVPVPLPASFTLLAPVNGAIGVPSGPTLAWTGAADAEQYVVEIDLSPTFPSPVVSEVVPAPEIVAVLDSGTLSPLTVYYWRVRAVNTSGERVSAPTVSAFTTAAPPPPRCTGDINADGVTDVYDFVELAGSFGTPGGATREDGDLNEDGAVNATDFGIFATNFGCQE